MERKDSENKQFITKEMQGIYLVQCGIDSLIDYFDKGETAKKEQREIQHMESIYFQLHDFNEENKKKQEDKVKKSQAKEKK